MISENLKNYFYLFRFDHSIKQIFVIPGYFDSFIFRLPN